MLSTAKKKQILKFLIILVIIIYFFNSIFEVKIYSRILPTLKEIKHFLIEVSRYEYLKFTHQDYEFKVNQIYAVVFFGRINQTKILLRYLEPNLKVNGGVLDKIVFAVKTKVKEDLEYLDYIMAQNRSYYQRIRYTSSKEQYREIYLNFKNDDLIFKIDDDIVYISNGTFEKMLNEYLNNKLLFLSANVVNHPILSYVHARLRAIKPFYEESPYSWKKYENDTELDKTDAFNSTYGPFSNWWTNPKCAAIAHESFFYNLKYKSIQVYNFNKWDFHSSDYSRWSINFVLMRGKYVNRMNRWFPLEDNDELTISSKIPKALKKHVYSLGSAVVVHFSYGVQIDYIINTNLLDRYDKLSRELHIRTS